MASDPRHLTIAATHEAPTTFTTVKSEPGTFWPHPAAFVSVNGYLELQNINMGSEAKKVDLSSHFFRTTSIACSSEPQVFIVKQ